MGTQKRGIESGGCANRNWCRGWPRRIGVGRCRYMHSLSAGVLIVNCYRTYLLTAYNRPIYNTCYGVD